MDYIYKFLPWVMLALLFYVYFIAPFRHGRILRRKEDVLPHARPIPSTEFTRLRYLLREKAPYEKRIQAAFTELDRIAASQKGFIDDETRGRLIAFANEGSDIVQSYIPELDFEQQVKKWSDSCFSDVDDDGGGVIDEPPPGVSHSEKFGFKHFNLSSFPRSVSRASLMLKVMYVTIHRLKKKYKK